MNGCLSDTIIAAWNVRIDGEKSLLHSNPFRKGLRGDHSEIAR